MSECPFDHAQTNDTAPAAPSPTRAGRWALAGIGAASVGIGGVGVVVPGLPTTIFLLFACWCFARSCPWLEARLRRSAVLGRYLRDFEPGRPIPRRARITATALMWIAITVSCIITEPLWLTVLLVALGAIGTACVWLFRRATLVEAAPVRA